MAETTLSTFYIRELTPDPFVLSASIVICYLSFGPFAVQDHIWHFKRVRRRNNTDTIQLVRTTDSLILHANSNPHLNQNLKPLP